MKLNKNANKDEALFNKIALSYYMKDKVLSSIIPRRNKLMQAVEPILRVKRTLGDVLEIGCGAGASAKYLKKMYRSYTGLDHSSEMINVARNFNQGNHLAKFIHADLTEMDSLPNQADTIISIGVLHHLSDIDQLMSSLKNISKNNADFIALEPIDVNPIVMLSRGIRKKIDSTYSDDQHFFSLSEIEDILLRNNLQKESIRFIGLFSNPLSQIILHPQFLFRNLSKLFVWLDNLILRYCPWILRYTAWSVVIHAKINTDSDSI